MSLQYPYWRTNSALGQLSKYCRKRSDWNVGAGILCMFCILLWLLQMTAEDSTSETQHDWRLAWLYLGAPSYRFFRISSSPGSHVEKPSTSWRDCIFIKITLTSRNSWLGEVNESICIWLSQNINTPCNIPMSRNISELDFVLLKPGNTSLPTP